MIEAIFHGHSFVEITTPEGSILIDPFIVGNTHCDVTVDDLTKKNILAIIVTHGHADHLGETIPLATETGCLVIATFEVANYLQSQGITTLSSQHIGGGVQYEGYHVKFTPALHGGAIGDTGLYGEAAGVLVRIDETVIYHAGDTGLTKEFELIGENTITIAFLPIGDRYTMGTDDAVRSLEMLRPKVVVPVHYDTRPVIQQDTTDFATRVMQQGIAVPKVLKPGQMVVLD